MSIGGASLFEDVLKEDYLELSSGVFVKNLTELVDALKKINKGDFDLHVTRGRNDFAEWILEAYNDERLTKQLLGTTDKGKILKILNISIKDAEKERPTVINSPKSKKNILKVIGETGNAI